MHQEIYRIAYQLSQEGKNPSVALIRSRLSVPTSLPIIVQALQQWKMTPELGKDQPPATIAEESDKAPVTSGTTEAMALMEKRIETLEAQVAQLMTLVKTQN
jgi:hypothetical protein